MHGQTEDGEGGESGAGAGSTLELFGLPRLPSYRTGCSANRLSNAWRHWGHWGGFWIASGLVSSEPMPTSPMLPEADFQSPCSRLATSSAMGTIASMTDASMKDVRSSYGQASFSTPCDDVAVIEASDGAPDRPLAILVPPPPSLTLIAVRVHLLRIRPAQRRMLSVYALYNVLCGSTLRDIIRIRRYAPGIRGVLKAAGTRSRSTSYLCYREYT